MTEATIAQESPLKEPLDDFRAQVEDAKKMTPETPAEERESLMELICLTSRSAYFDFFLKISTKELNPDQKIDPTWQPALNALFQDAIHVMDAGAFKATVEKRYEEFKEFCRTQNV